PAGPGPPQAAPRRARPPRRPVPEQPGGRLPRAGGPGPGARPPQPRPQTLQATPRRAPPRRRPLPEQPGGALPGPGAVALAASLATGAVLACRLPHVDRTNVAELRADDLTCTASTVRQLRGLGGALLASGKGGDSSIPRQAVHAYALAADLLDHLRADVLH